MEHLLLKAVTTATDEGVFEAVISTATIDREKDVVDANAMVEALHRWTSTGKNIPLAWNHSTAAEDQIGYVEPATARNVNGEVVVKGWIDRSTEVGGHAWRLVKAGTLGFSFGYLVLKANKRQGGGRHITGLDVFEITATTTPMNGDTRVLGWKADDKAMSPEQMASRMRAMADEMASDDPPDPADMAKRMRAMAEQMATMGKALEKAVWSAAFINDLPDSSFLYIEPGGSKDSEGKTTPRSLRHFPYKDSSGAVDLPHLRNALSRIPQSSLPQDVKDRLTARAQRILDNMKTVDVTDKEPERVRSVDPLTKNKRQADDQRLKMLVEGVPLKSPNKVERPERKPELALEDLKRRMRDEMLVHLSGETT